MAAPVRTLVENLVGEAAYMEENAFVGGVACGCAPTLCKTTHDRMSHHSE